MTRFAVATCYQCDAKSTGREHVPPKCLFPKGSNWSSLMTVPSCATHNNATSDADEYLRFLLGAIASNIPETIRSNVARGAVRLAQKRSRNLHRYGLEWNCEVLAIDKPIPVDIELLSTCLEKIARALYFHHHFGRRKLLCELSALPLFIPIEPETHPELSAAVNEIRAWTASYFDHGPKLGMHQEIFAYQVIEIPTTILINMEFYGAHRASVVHMTARTGSHDH